MSTIYIVFVSQILLFSEFLSSQLNSQLPVMSSCYLFHMKSISLTSAQVSTIIENEKENAINEQITLMSWHNIVIALDQELLLIRNCSVNLLFIHNLMLITWQTLSWLNTLVKLRSIIMLFQSTCLWVSHSIHFILSLMLAVNNTHCLIYKTCQLWRSLLTLTLRNSPWSPSFLNNQVHTSNQLYL